MAGQRSSMKPQSWITTSGAVLLLAGQLLVVLNACAAAQTDGVASHDTSTESVDLDQHDHTSAMVEMMTPHQQHSGPHMKWTTLRPPNATDALRAEPIAPTPRPTHGE